MKGKTANVARSKEQFEWLNTAIANRREMQQTIRSEKEKSEKGSFLTNGRLPQYAAGSF